MIKTIEVQTEQSTPSRLMLSLPYGGLPLFALSGAEQLTLARLYFLQGIKVGARQEARGFATLSPSALSAELGLSVAVTRKALMGLRKKGLLLVLEITRNGGMQRYAIICLKRPAILSALNALGVEDEQAQNIIKQLKALQERARQSAQEKRTNLVSRLKRDATLAPKPEDLGTKIKIKGGFGTSAVQERESISADYPKKQFEDDEQGYLADDGETFSEAKSASTDAVTASDVNLKTTHSRSEKTAEQKQSLFIDLLSKNRSIVRDAALDASAGAPLLLEEKEAENNPPNNLPPTGYGEDD